MNAQTQVVLCELRRRLESVYGDRLVRLLLYGSQARGDAEPGSDIDVLVILRGAVSPCEEIARTLSDVSELSLEHDVVVACAFLSEDQFDRERSPFVCNVRREGISV